MFKMNQNTIKQIAKFSQNSQVIAINNIAMAFIRVDAIYVDNNHPHREPRVNQKRVKEIAAKWNVKKAGAVNVFFRPSEDKIFAIGNGNHRFEAAKVHGAEYIPATIITNADSIEEYEIIKGLNDQKQFTTKDNFRVDLAAGNPQAKLIDALVTKNKFKLEFAHKSTETKKQTNTNNINCIGTVIKIASLDNGPEILDRSLATIFKCCKVEGSRKGVVEKPALKDSFIFAVAKLVEAFGNDKFKMKAIEEVLLENKIDDFVERSNKFQTSAGGIEARANAMKKYIMELADIEEVSETLEAVSV
jgi:hypothetical protein